MNEMYNRFSEINSLKSQQDMLSAISEIRGYEDNRRFNLAKAVQIYNHEVLVSLLGDHELYHACFHSGSGECIVYGKLLVPGFTPTKELITYITYDVINQQEAKIKGENAPAYFYPESSILMRKGSFLYAPPDAWDKILESDDVYVVDGVWDCVTLNMLGIPCVALLTSSLSPEAKRILRCFKRVHLVMDNDGAGGQLYQEMLRTFSSVFRVVVPISIGKDVDNYVVAKGERFFSEQLSRHANIYLKGD